MILAFAAAAALAAPSLAVPAPEAAAAASEEVRIPFVNFGGIRSFHANDDDVVYLQDNRRRWYRAELIGSCWGLPWANRVRVDTRGGSTVDRFSTLIVDGERCQLGSLTRSDEPERRPWKNRDADRS
ncbi:MAG: DUF6491 family protein [Allosphingosinicella sp.]